MKKIHWLMLVCAGIIIIVCCAISAGTMDREAALMETVKAECSTDGQTIELELWKDDDDGGAYYLFLPSWYSRTESSLTLRYEEWLGSIRLDGREVRDGSLWTDDGKEELHVLEIYDRSGVCRYSTTLQILVSENLPTLFITVEDQQDLLKLEEFDNKKYIEAGSAMMIDGEGNVLWQEELDRFKVRGNLTATYDKKPFTFSFSKPHEVLGMEPALKWNLLANATDGSYIRNKLIRDLAYESIDAYEPQGEFTEVYLNGVYQGLYLLTEAVEIAENRIEIDPDENWFVEMELDFRAEDDVTKIVTEQGQTFIVHSESVVTKEQLSTIENRLNDVESALFAEDGISQISGRALEELIDLPSFAEAWLIEELSGDHDIGISSQFAYALKDEDSLWYAGPVWDFDGIMANVNTPMYGVPEALTSTIWMSRPEESKNQNRWLAAMWKHPEFQKIVKELYCSSFRKNYENALKTEIDEYVRVIQKSAKLDALRWHAQRTGWWFTIPEALLSESSDAWEDSYDDRFDTLEEHISVVKDFMSRKLTFLDRLWIEEVDFCVVEIRNAASFLNQDYNQTLYYWVERGTAIENLPSYEDNGFRFEGYFDTETGERVEDGTIIDSDLVIEGVWTKEERE